MGKVAACVTVVGITVWVTEPTSTDFLAQQVSLLQLSSFGLVTHEVMATIAAVPETSIRTRAHLWAVWGALTPFSMLPFRKRLARATKLWPAACCHLCYLLLLYAGLWFLFSRDVPQNVIAGLSLFPVSALMAFFHGVLGIGVCGVSPYTTSTGTTHR